MKFQKFTALLLSLFIAFAFSGCSDEKTKNQTNAQLARNYLQAYYDFQPSDEVSMAAKSAIPENRYKVLAVLHGHRDGNESVEKIFFVLKNDGTKLLKNVEQIEIRSSTPLTHLGRIDGERRTEILFKGSSGSFPVSNRMRELVDSADKEVPLGYMVIRRPISPYERELTSEPKNQVPEAEGMIDVRSRIENKTLVLEPDDSRWHVYHAISKYGRPDFPLENKFVIFVDRYYNGTGDKKYKRQQAYIVESN